MANVSGIPEESGMDMDRRWQQVRWLMNAIISLHLAMLLSLSGAVAQGAGSPPAGANAEGATSTARPAAGAQSASVRSQDTKLINGHLLVNPDGILSEPGDRREKFRKLHQERLWAVAELEQQRSELNRLLLEPHHKPTPVPVVSEASYNARVSDIDTMIRHFEARQNNHDLTESDRAEAHAQLLDLTRQKARAAMELTTYRSNQQELAAYNDVIRREDRAKEISADTLAYLSRLDAAIGELMMSSDAESDFRLRMGLGFVALVTVLIGCFFYFGSRDDTIKDMLQGDLGLQFVTLFSLVIAITMFGLLNILEGKELSALLGGLAGYILGRSRPGSSGGDDRHTGRNRPGQGDVQQQQA